MNSTRSFRSAFTLIELLIVLGLIGMLCALVLPAVQAVRESARCTQCQNNLKNIGLALNNFHAARGSYPAGSDDLAHTEHAWSSRILPYLEQTTTSDQIDFRQRWDAPGPNLAAADQELPVYICPSAIKVSIGKQDYGGIYGTALLPLVGGMGPTGAFGCGTLVVINQQQPKPVSSRTITDGLSNTLCVGESVDREDPLAGRWACGHNCFSQNDPYINVDLSGSLHSIHPAIANALFADGHVRSLNEEIAPTVLGALCTRNGGEADNSSTLR